jgi:hypothetical protein
VARSDDIKTYYETILQRSASDDEVSAWDNSGKSLDDIRSAFISSDEGQHVQAVIRMYQAAFGRVPDQGGLKNWCDSGKSPAEIAESFVNSDEFHLRYGTTEVTEAFITSLYNQVLGRMPDDGGMQNWMNSGLSAAQILANFSESQESKNNSTGAIATFLDDCAKGTQDYSGKLMDTKPVAGAQVELPAAVANGSAVIITEKQLLKNMTDADGDKLSVQSVSVDTQYGTVVDNKDGTWSYTPTAGTNGGVFFGVVVTDGTTPVFTSANMPVTPGAAVPSFTVTADQASVNEGSAVTFKIETTAAAGTEIAYTLKGVDAADLAEGALTGKCIVGADGKASVQVHLAEDKRTDGAKTLKLELDGKNVSHDVSVNDTSVADSPTYAVTANEPSVKEGEWITFNLSTTGVAAGTKIAYTLDGIDANDLQDDSLTGEFTVGEDGKASIQVHLAADKVTEGTENLIITLDGKDVSAAVEVSDTSPDTPTEEPTYVLTSNEPSVNEGEWITFNLDTTDVEPGTKIAYTLSGVDAADIVNGQLTGEFTVGEDGKASVIVELAADAITEGAETLKLELDGKSVSANVTVNDTSVTPPNHDPVAGEPVAMGAIDEDTALTLTPELYEQLRANFN